ncbi:hypothetical protein [Arthrobacter sp. StoSoilB13]|uniref:hypothetical protein n=1 Tax=Arthrobacter sp. StoSoilB13 TaxID=2830993 RepID=UPI001CC6C495|nr:hypothetical protein [Arthrobacter sp. StoSoilB13]BCW47923.1 hypothetical protein StoSoilB13_02650 [Arthrobacter sp. StoSoilB13]
MNLTWFEKLPDMDAYRVNGQYAPYALNARDVRFTDAELMAEYHKLDCRLYQRQYNEVCSGDDYTEESWERHAHMQNTIYRFAEAPHFDENQST